ncbi:uncharacterized protein LOC117532223 isoform X2 [Thalassophryne amazonica]|uniref:uncharacterized protein LOC117532223 isoform X2 n=1 Tax=Thalassophryne amazonica TaxID=390379 RepID=UPI001470BB5B|nr:uncharacterized protein LOC117532223 isoform X2 [Thalassophryne amazonica]
MAEVDKQDEEFLHVRLREGRKENGYIFGFFEGDLREFLEEYMSLNLSCFILSERHSKEDNHKRYSPTAPPVWEDKRGNVPIYFEGRPFRILGLQTWHCLHGPLKDARGGSKPKEAGERDYNVKKRLRKQGSRKLECPAQIQIRDAMVFEDYGVDVSSCKTEHSIRLAKEKMAKKLKQDLQNGVQGQTTIRHYIRIPLSSIHKGHPVGKTAGMNQHTESSEQDPQKKAAGKKEEEKVILMLQGVLREKVKCISDLTYLVQNVSVLQNALGSLENVVKAMDDARIKQEGLPVCQSRIKRKLKLQTVEYHKVFHSKLPHRKRFRKQKGSRETLEAATEDFEPTVKHHRSEVPDVFRAVNSDNKIVKDLECSGDQEDVIEVTGNPDTLGPSHVTKVAFRDLRS